ncbi:helix-turn-helix transcriptional regulator [Butyricicoccus pullicaecorum]|nr:helix-turn-helix transcriptional regulator [Butyricicoccus pullicaecorum]
MLCQNETGVLSGSEIFFNTVGPVTQRLFYYVGCCGHYYCERGYKINRRHMDSLLLMLIEKGEMRLDYQNQKYTALPGDIILLDGTFPQYYDTGDYVEFYWMHLGGVNSFELCEHLSRARGGILFRTANNEQAATLIRDLVSQFANHQTISDAEHSRLLHSILCYLMPGSRSDAAETPDSPVRQATRFIEAHLGEKLSLERVAEAVHLSPSHLICLFRAELHHSPHEYIVLLRMDRAKYLLKTTSLPIKAIAVEVGYGNESSFTGAFTERIGISPRRFRELPLG